MSDETQEETAGGELDTKETEALAGALNHSAERVQTLWFSFLTFMIYLAIAAETTTHRMLFFESPLNLPVLNIALPLLGFYALSPTIFVVLHFYMLLNLVLLARTAKSFEDVLVIAFPVDGDSRENFRMRIENTPFIQLLVGGKLEREGCNAKLLSLMALITLALAPVALLLTFQIKFLPYHSESITWLHRGLLFIDLAFVWTLWPAYRNGWGSRWRPTKNWRMIPTGALSLAVLFYAIGIATFPDERMYSAINWFDAKSYWDVETGDLRSSGRPQWYRMIAPVNNLDLHGQDLIENSKLEDIIKKNEASANALRWTPTVSLRGRDFTEANLREADLRHADFSGAILNRADLSFAWAKNAHFDNARIRGAALERAQLQGASFKYAQLQGAYLDGAQLHGATLDEAKLQGAFVSFAFFELIVTQLPGASLNGTQLQGAIVSGANLQAASLKKANLQAAELGGTNLQGAWLNSAQLQGASLGAAKLKGAWLAFTQLQGAILDNAVLEGAWLERAQLQGTSLKEAQLLGAWLEDVFVWRSDVRTANWKGAHVTRPETGQKYSCMKNESETTCDWSHGTYGALKTLLTNEILRALEWYSQRGWLLSAPGEELNKTVGEKTVGEELRKLKDEQLRAVMARVDPRLDPTVSLDGEEAMAKNWADHERSSHANIISRDSADNQWRNISAEQWREAGCAPDGAPYVAREILARTREYFFPRESRQAHEVAAAFLDVEHCPGARGLSEAEISELKALRDHARAKDSKTAPGVTPTQPKR